MTVKWYIYIVCLIFLSSCGDGPPPSTIGETMDDFDVPTNIPSGEEPFMNLKSDYIFDQDGFFTYELLIPSSKLTELNQDPAAEDYVEGSLVFQGDTISPVGIRYKGSIGGFVDCLSGGSWSEPSGFKTCSKLSMKVKINWDGANYKFFGLKKLQFHSMNQDDSQMRDRLAYHLFREMGAPAPRSVHARMLINGQFAGLFSLVEQIDGRFAKFHFDDKDGNVYKEVWPLKANGAPQNINTFIGALKTNEENPAVGIMQSFANKLSTETANNIPAVIEEYMDVRKAIAYCVVDRAIRHDDGPFHWYCGGECGNHNYYWYEEPTNKKLHLIAWDMDNAFENLGSNGNTVTEIPDAWGEISNDCEPFKNGWLGWRQKSAACDKLTQGFVTFDVLYDELRSELIAGPMSVEADGLIDQWAEQIISATEQAANEHTDAISISRWQAAIQDLKDQLQISRSQ